MTAQQAPCHPPRLLHLRPDCLVPASPPHTARSCQSTAERQHHLSTCLPPRFQHRRHASHCQRRVGATTFSHRTIRHLEAIIPAAHLDSANGNATSRYCVATGSPRPQHIRHVWRSNGTALLTSPPSPFLNRSFWSARTSRLAVPRITTFGCTTLSRATSVRLRQTVDPTRLRYRQHKSSPLASPDGPATHHVRNSRPCDGAFRGIDLGGHTFGPGVYGYRRHRIQGRSTLNGPGVYSFRTALTLIRRQLHRA